jgi:hypothetical protein
MASASFVIVHAVLWTKHRGEDASRRKGTDAARALRYLIVIVLMALLPFGITGWAHPLTAAGVLFPGWGWLRWTGQGGGARADFFANPVVEVDGVRIAPLICYEQLILSPVLQSMLYSPQGDRCRWQWLVDRKHFDRCHRESERLSLGKTLRPAHCYGIQHIGSTWDARRRSYPSMRRSDPQVGYR